MAADNGDSCLRKIITLADLSVLVVVSERTIQRLVKEGVIPLAKNKLGQPMRGKFVLGEAVPHFVEHLRDTLAADDPAKAEYHRERARKMKLDADNCAMDLEVKKGELLRKSDIEFELTQVIRNVRDAFRALPSRLMYELSHQADPRMTNQILTEAIDGLLHRVADGEVFDLKRLRSESRDYLHSQGFDSGTAEEILDERDRHREEIIKQSRAERGV